MLMQGTGLAGTASQVSYTKDMRTVKVIYWACLFCDELDYSCANRLGRRSRGVGV